MNFYLRWLTEMSKLKGLGKGLDALLSASNVSLAESPTGDVELKQIELDKIKPGKYQPRRHFDSTELEELSASIKTNGVIQPVIVRKVGNGYELIAGERRYRASIMAGLKTIPTIVRDFSDKEALAISLIENIQRKDLNVIEESKGYKRLIDEFKLTHEDLAAVTSRSRSHITNILRLLKLHPDVQEMLIDRQMEMGHARALLPLNEQQQVDLAFTIINDGLTTLEVERRVAKILQEKDNVLQDEKVKLDPDIVSLETKIADKLGMVVKIKHGRNGAGRVTLSYNSLDELDNLLNLVK
jgi:ParB family chromosome partitioning protein